MKSTNIKIGTRKSKLALYQANLVREKLEQLFPDITFSLVPTATKGDKILDVALSKIGDKGLFTKELELALFRKEIDLCVHSLKDLPTVSPQGAKIGAILKRAEYKDAWVSREGMLLEEMGQEHTVATSSLRRKAQVLRINPQVKVIDIRGNVDTRLQKMKDGYCDAMVMAGAGLIRLGYQEQITTLFPPQYLVPACGQGAIAVEIRDNDADIEHIVSQIHDRVSYYQVSAERSFLNALQGGCQIPIGAHATITGEQLTIIGLVALPDGSKELRSEITGHMEEAEKLGRHLAEQVIAQGAHEILRQVRQDN